MFMENGMNRTGWQACFLYNTLNWNFAVFKHQLVNFVNISAVDCETGRPGRGSSFKSFRPLLNSETHDATIEYEGEDFP